MRIYLDEPTPIEKLREEFNDSVTYITSTTQYPLVEAIEFSGGIQKALKRRIVPLDAKRKIDRALQGLDNKLRDEWNKVKATILSEEGVRKFTKAEFESDDRPEKKSIVQKHLAELALAFSLAASNSFDRLYQIGKERGQGLTGQPIDDELSPEDKEEIESLIEEHQEKFDNFVNNDLYAEFAGVIDGEYPDEVAYSEALEGVMDKKLSRLDMYAMAALGAFSLGFSESVKAASTEEGEVEYEGGYWHTVQDDKVCDGCEGNEGVWMTLDHFATEYQTNECLTNCRCGELFEPAPHPDDESEKMMKVWDEAQHPRDETGKFSEVEVYHSTTLERSASILKEGIVSGKYRNFDDSFYTGDRANKVFVTTSKVWASFYATNSEVVPEGEKGVTVVAKIPEDYFKSNAEEDLALSVAGREPSAFSLPHVKAEWIVGIYDPDTHETKPVTKVEEKLITVYFPSTSGLYEKLVSMTKGWIEELHPRDESGRFSESGGVKEHLGSGTKIIVSAERGNLTPEENARKTANLEQSLKLYSDDVVRQKGVWGGKEETSFIVSVSPENADRLENIAFRVLDQDAVIRLDDGNAELRFKDGSKQVGRVDNLEVDPEAKDNYSQIGNVKYHLNFREKK